MKLCTVSGCDKKHVANGLCRMHYMRVQRRGGVEPTRRAPGTGTITVYGYHTVGNLKKQEHRRIAETALGHPLPPKAEVHHVNGIRSDNRPENLVICPSRAYHFLLHVRADALAKCGNPNFRMCTFCKSYDDPAALTYNVSRYFYHPACKTADNRRRKAA